MYPNRNVRLLLILWIILLLGGTFVYISRPSQLALTITDESSGRRVFAQPAQPGDAFVIRFIHSVHKTPVEEHFLISEDASFTLQRVVYETYGVGNPSGPEQGERFHMEDGKLTIEGMDRRMHVIHQRIGQKVADHTLLMNGRSWPFTSWSEPGNRVKIQVERMSILETAVLMIERWL